MQLGQRRAAVESGGIGVDALGLQRITLGPAFGGLGRQPRQGATFFLPRCRFLVCWFGV